MKVELRGLLEAILLSAKAPMTVEDIKDVFKRAWEAIKDEEDAPDHDEVYRMSRLKKSEIIRELEALENEWDERAGAYRIRCVAEAWRLISEPEYSTWLRTLYGKRVRPPRLTQPAMETLAIVAYRQPLTRAQIEEIRGVAVDGVVSTLVERELIEPAGKADAPGRPTLYQTTEGFLEYFGLRDLSDLPDAGELCRIAPDVETSSGEDAESDSELEESAEGAGVESEAASDSVAREERSEQPENREEGGSEEILGAADEPDVTTEDQEAVASEDSASTSAAEPRSGEGEVENEESDENDAQLEPDDSRVESLLESEEPVEVRSDVAFSSTKEPMRALERTRRSAPSDAGSKADPDSRALVFRARALGGGARAVRKLGASRLFTRREARVASRLLARRWEELETGPMVSRGAMGVDSGHAMELAGGARQEPNPGSMRALVPSPERAREEESKSTNRRGWRTSKWFQWIKKISIIIVSKLIGWIGKLFKCSMIVSLTLSLSARSR